MLLVFALSLSCQSRAQSLSDLRPAKRKTSSHHHTNRKPSDFETAEPNAPELLSFEKAIEKIVDRDPLVEKAREAWKATAAKNVPEHLILYPTLQLGAGTFLQRSTDQTNTDTFREIFASSTFNIYHFGADVATMKAATAQELSLEKRLEFSILTSEDTALGLVVQVITNSMELAAGKMILDRFDDSYQLLQSRFHTGLASEEELGRIEVDLGHLHDIYYQTQKNLIQSKAGLRAALGSDQIEIKWPWKERIRRATFADEDLERKVLRLRPDWQAAERNLASFDYQVKASYGLIYPSLDVNVSGGYASIIDQGVNQPYYSVGVFLTIPLFDRLANISNYQSLVHQRTSAQMDLEIAKRNAQAQWQEVRDVFAASVKNALDRDVLLVKARSLSEDIGDRITNGNALADVLILDQRRVYDAALDSIHGWRDAHQFYGNACHALGYRISNCSTVSGDKFVIRNTDR